MSLPLRSLALADPLPRSSAAADPTGRPVLCGGVDDERAHAWLDGELTASAARAFAAHLHACRGCRSHAAELAAFLDAVRRSTRRRGERAPDRLRALVRSLAAAEAPGGLPGRVAADANAG